jgi:hypothetical protein
MCAFTNSDSNDARTLTEQVSVQGGEYNNTVESCTSACNAAGYVKAGVEFANQCCTPFTSSLNELPFSNQTFAAQGCGDSINNGGSLIDNKNCMLACSGDSIENCGGPNALVLYNYGGGT